MSKWVLITGSSRGIGSATAKVFASKGYNIYLNCLKEIKKAECLKEELEDKYHVNVKILPFDVRNEQEVKETFLKIKNIDVLVNNAGIAIDKDIHDKTEEEFMQVIKTNLLGTFLVSKYASLCMKKGVIINVASNSAINDANPWAMDYDASKAGIISLTHNLALRLAPNIRVNAVAPGWIKTDMNKDLSPNFKSDIQNKCLLNRMGSSLEVANVIYFLASDEASFINDTVIRVDGGLK